MTADDGEWAPDMHWLSDDLAVGGSFPSAQARALAERHRIGAVVDLRGEDCDDELLLRDSGITLMHLPTPDLRPASIEMLDRGVDFVRDRIACGEKVLIHCQHGIGRSALLALCVLVDQGWAPLDALSHTKDRRPAVSPSREQYDGWVKWLERRRLPVPDFHSFGCIAYRRPAKG